MEQLHFTTIMTHVVSPSLRGAEVFSALPDAPQVGHVAKTSSVRTATSRVLLRLADRVAPAPAC